GRRKNELVVRCHARVTKQQRRRRVVLACHVGAVFLAGCARPDPGAAPLGQTSVTQAALTVGGCGLVAPCPDPLMCLAPGRACTVDADCCSNFCQDLAVARVCAAPPLAVSPDNKQFAPVAVGQSAAQTFVAANSSGRPTGAIDCRTEGDGFAIGKRGCMGPLDPMAACACDVIFQPTTPGPKTG